MDNKIILEIIGYVGSAFVLISFLMATVIKLRIVNSIGSIISVVYGLLIHAYPTVVMNAALLCINIFYLVKMYRYKASFHIVPSSLSDASTKFFLELNKDDITAFFPDFATTTDNQSDFVRLIYCENKIVGLFAAQKESDNTLNILLDYTTKEYRDYSVGHYLFNALTAENISILHFSQKAINHEQYLKKTGFKLVDGRYELKM